MDAELRRLEYTHELDVEDRRLKEKYMEMEDRRVTRGQWMSFTISLLILGVLFAAVMTGAHAAAAVLAGSAITVGVGSFVYNNRHEPSAQPQPQPQGQKTAAPIPEAVT
ncbi:hypothetical protein ACFWTE_11645 [Nocardiopsis sp. NPDC058631]|uniref:hypothetical protein n=1 Tax=Nocardiopsis sp. NPDC058631 TaxID=3346566 RepID=UPI003657FDD6